MDERKEFENPDLKEPLRDDDPFREEVGAEFAPTRPDIFTNRDRMDSEVRREVDEHGGTGFGVTGLILSILSLLSFMPVLLGIAAIVLGMMAFSRGSRGLGIWSIAIAAISLINQFFIAPNIT